MQIYVVSGFLGAGKTTFIKKYLDERPRGIKVAIIENEFGKVNIDGKLLADTGASIREISQGCVCCTLSVDLRETLQELERDFQPDVVWIEPTGLAKLSEVLQAIEKQFYDVSRCFTVVNADKLLVLRDRFGAFWADQVAYADTVVLSRTADMSKDALAEVIREIKKTAPEMPIVSTAWEQLSIAQMLDAKSETAALRHAGHEQVCACGHAHADHGHCHDPARDQHGTAEHDHAHAHDHHGHCEHDHHHEENVFASGFEAHVIETPQVYARAALQARLAQLDRSEFGQVLRAKGIVEGEGGWLRFDFVQGEIAIADAAPNTIGQICIIGKDLEKALLDRLFALV